MPDYSQMGGAAGGLIGGPVGAGIGSLAGGLLGLLAGGSQKRKGRSLINQPFPIQQIPTEVTQAAAEGLPAEQYNQAMRNIQRQQSAAIQAAQDRRGGLQAIGRTQLVTNNAMGNLDAQNAQTRQRNQLRLGEWRDKVWQSNVKDKYNRDYNYGMQLLGAGNQNTNTGLDKVGTGLGYLGAGLLGGRRRSSVPSDTMAGDNYSDNSDIA